MAFILPIYLRLLMCVPLKCAQIWCALCNVTLLHADWSKERLIEAWFSDMVEVCEKAGIPIPDLNSETHTLH